MKNRDHELKFRAFAFDVVKYLNLKATEHQMSIEDELELFSELVYTRSKRINEFKYSSIEQGDSK